MSPPTGGGSVTRTPNNIFYSIGDVVTVTQTPAAGYTFSGWSGACSGSGSCVVTMGGNRTVTANYTPIEYTLAVTPSGSGSVARNPSQSSYHYGDSVQLTATPETGWSFVRWSGDLTGSTNPASITINGNKTISALFAQNQFSLSANVTGQGSIAKSPDQALYALDQGSDRHAHTQPRLAFLWLERGPVQAAAPA